jgi:hypothetical protein
MLRKNYVPISAALMVMFGLIPGDLSVLAQIGFDDGVTLLMSAARDADQSTFNRALKKTSDINAQDAYGWTALTYAVVRGDTRMTKKLLSMHANPNIVDEDGRSILMHAVDYNREDIVKLLVEYKADLDHRDNRGATGVGLAWVKSNDRIVALLEKVGAAKLRTADKRADIYSPLPPYNGPFLLDNRDSMDALLPFASSGVHELKMRVLVGTDGTVRRVRVVIGLPNGGTAAAVRDAYNSRYQPATKNGQPIEAWADRGMTIRKTIPLQGPFRY